MTREEPTIISLRSVPTLMYVPCLSVLPASQLDVCATFIVKSNCETHSVTTKLSEAGNTQTLISVLLLDVSLQVQSPCRRCFVCENTTATGGA